MQIHEPLLLALACVFALLVAVLLAVGVRFLGRPALKYYCMGLTFVLLALAEVPLIAALGLHAFEPHRPTLTVLPLVAFSMGLVTAAVVTIAALWRVNRRESRSATLAQSLGKTRHTGAA